MNDLLSIWVNGIGVGSFLLCSFYLFMSDRDIKGARRVSVLFGISLFYLATRLAFEVLYSAEDPIFHGYGHQTLAIISMFTTYPMSLVMIEMTHYTQVTWKVALLRLSFPLAVIATFIYMITHDMPESVYVFRLFSIYSIVYTVFNVIQSIRATRRYEDLLRMSYVNFEERSINWFWNTMLVGVILFIMNAVIANFHFSSTLENIGHLCSTVVWCFLSHRIGVLRGSLIPYWKDVNAEEEEDEYQRIQSAEQVSKPIAVAQFSNSEADEDNTEATTDIRESLEMIQAKKFVEEMRQKLEEKNLLFDEELNRDDVMHLMSVTHVTLGRYIHLATGMTFANYICDLRLEKIADLLLKSDDTIERIFYSCGFQSRATFYRVFSKKYGCSPVEFRKMSQKNVS